MVLEVGLYLIEGVRLITRRFCGEERCAVAVEDDTLLERGEGASGDMLKMRSISTEAEG